MWQEKDGALYRHYEFANFGEAVHFTNTLIKLANHFDHHPKYTHNFNQVDVWLTTVNKNNTITDKDRQFADAIDSALSNNTSSEMQQSITKQGDVVEIKMYSDGGSRGNPGPSAGGFVLLDMNDNVLASSGKYLGITTNNQAEYHSLKGGLEAALRLDARIVHVYMDSLLVINQMKGIFKIRNRDLWPIHEAIKELTAQFQKVTFQHVPRELNKLADSIVNETLDEHADNIQ